MHVQVLVDAGVDLGRAHGPIFTYLLSGKQRDQLNRVCADNGWLLPQRCAVTLDMPAVAHVLRSREVKDKVTPAFVAKILASAYSDHSTVHVNKERGEQALFLNFPTKLVFQGSAYHAVAIVAIDGVAVNGERELQSRTAYHVTERKYNAMKRGK